MSDTPVDTPVTASPQVVKPAEKMLKHDLHKHLRNFHHTHGEGTKADLRVQHEVAHDAAKFHELAEFGAMISRTAEGQHLDLAELAPHAGHRVVGRAVVDHHDRHAQLREAGQRAHQVVRAVTGGDHHGRLRHQRVLPGDVVVTPRLRG